MCRNLLFAPVLALVFALAPASALADGWTGAGEFGLVLSSGNTDTDTLNLKLGLKHEDEQWLQAYTAQALRAETDGDTTADRYEVGARIGYKLTGRSYIVGSLRYEDDQFSPYNYQATFGLGYGYKAIDTPATQLVFEIGPGYRRAEPIDGDSEGDVIGRGFVDFKHKITDTTDLVDTLLVEAASNNTHVQNDLGLQVKISTAFALKATFQWRHNSEVPAGTDSDDTLLTMNVVYGF